MQKRLVFDLSLALCKTLDGEGALKALCKHKCLGVDSGIIAGKTVIIVDLDPVAVVSVLDVSVVDLLRIKREFLAVDLDRFELYVQLLSGVLTTC